MFRFGNQAFRYLIPRYAPDDGAAAGNGGSGDGAGAGGSGDGGSGSGTGASSGQQDGRQPAAGDIPEEALKARLERARAQGRREAEDQARAEQDAALQQRQQFEQLAVTRQQTIESLQARVKELESEIQSVEERATAAEKRATDTEAVLQKTVDEQLKDVPAHLTSLVKKMPVTEQLEYLAEHRDEITKPRNSAVPANPAGDGRGSGGTPDNDDALAVYLSGRYGKPPGT